MFGILQGWAGVTVLIGIESFKSFGVNVMGKKPGWNAFGGMALIFSGLIAIDGRLLFRRASKSDEGKSGK